MSPPRLSYHFFRMPFSFFEEAVGRDVTVPINGTIVVPPTIADIDAYVRRQRAALAPRVISWMYEHDSSNYALLIARAIKPTLPRRILGQIDVYPEKSLRHASPDRECQACQAAFMAQENKTAENYAAYRLLCATYANRTPTNLTPEQLVAHQDQVNLQPAS